MATTVYEREMCSGEAVINERQLKPQEECGAGDLESNLSCNTLQTMQRTASYAA